MMLDGINAHARMVMENGDGDISLSLWEMSRITDSLHRSRHHDDGTPPATVGAASGARDGAAVSVTSVGSRTHT